MNTHHNNSSIFLREGMNEVGIGAEVSSGAFVKGSIFSVDPHDLTGNLLKKLLKISFPSI